MKARRVAEVLWRYRWHHLNEAELQEEIARRLDEAGIGYERERALGPRSRVDFFVDGVAVEVKTQGSRAGVLRQLHRYAEHEDVEELLLVTPLFKLDVPSEMCGKPVGLCRLERPW